MLHLIEVQVHWIEAQSTAVITILTFGFCYALAAMIFGAARLFLRHAELTAMKLKEASPVTMTPLALILGLLIVFLASRVWTNLDRVREYIGQEASALQQAVLLTDALPSDVRSGVRQAIKNHIHFIEVEDWPAMANAEASIKEVPPWLVEAMTMLLSFTPTQPNQQLAQQRAVAAIERALELRRSRIQISRIEISVLQWNIVILIAALVLIMLAILHINARLAQAVTMVMFSTALAICLTLLLIYDRPFSAGGFTMTPTLLREVAPD